MSLPLSINKRVATDLRGILSFYEQESGSSLADGLYDELMSRLRQIQENPKRFPFSTGDRRRANLNRFPYHLLYRIKPDSIRILVLRHDKQDPQHGLSRQ